MAVYTHLERSRIQSFLNDYNLGRLKDFEGIRQGVENTNYHIFTECGRYILTVFEKRVEPADLPFFFAFTDHLAASGLPCPRTLADKTGEKLKNLAGKPAALITYLEGSGLDDNDITVDHCRQMGRMAARMHHAAEDFPLERPNTMGLEQWKELFARCMSRMDEVEANLAQKLADEIAFLEERIPHNLPKGVVHADLFPDNVFFDRDTNLTGVIDFYFSCTESFAYDLAMTINAWCFRPMGQFSPERLKAMLDGYQAVRPLSDREKGALETLCRASALRICMTRLYDWLFHPADAYVTPKDPRSFLNRLHFHQHQGLRNAA